MVRNGIEIARNRLSNRSPGTLSAQKGMRKGRVSSASELTKLLVPDAECAKQVNTELAVDQLRLQFLANMNHELRTPLHGLMGATELLSLTKLDAEQQHYLDIFRSSSQQLLGLVENILDFSKMLSGEFKLHKTHFDLKQVIRDCYDHFLPFAKRKSIDLILTIDDTTPRWVNGDAKRVSQIIYHLVANGLKFTPEGRVTLSVASDVDVVTIRVKDTGVGIPAAQHDRIFEAFYQEDVSHTRKYGGAGMGLAISHFLANAMEGELKMSSEPDRGSEFSFRFPSTPLSEDSQTEEAALDAQPRILLVEDNEINQAIVYLLFSKRGIHIDIAQDGLEGLNCHKQKPYDLIFMDMQMPVMDGIEATKQIRKFDTDVQIVALTANMVPQDKEKALKAGMNDYLCKPLDQGSLEKILDQARHRLRN
ncbi:MAG: response regulator [Bdellovibrionota bacterium]|nr:MAG: response regulator [Pseudomonadota bacterium]